MKRRTLLISGLGLVVAGVALRIGLSKKETGVVRMIHARLDYLTLDPAGVAQYAKDCFPNGLSGSKLRMIAAAGSMYDFASRHADNKPNNSILIGEDKIVGEYLLSSDFFVNGADPKKVVHYLGYFDGYKDYQPCGNPFARKVDAFTA